MNIEIPVRGDGSSRIENLSERASRRLAMRISRRSFLGRLGRGVIVAAVGSAAGPFLISESAYAHTNPCSKTCSVSCKVLTGSNSCPSGTSNCGCWCITSTACTNYREWCDCCGDNYCSGRRQCVNGAPSCYNHRAYSASGDTHIACRFNRCVTASNCERFENPC